MIYCLISRGQPLRPGLLRCRAARGHRRSALLSPTASLRSRSVPPRSLPQFRRSQVLLLLLPLWLLIMVLKLFSIPAPQSVDQEQHLCSPASPQASLVSLFCRVPSLLGHLLPHCVLGSSGSSRFTWLGALLKRPPERAGLARFAVLSQNLFTRHVSMMLEGCIQSSSAPGRLLPPVRRPAGTSLRSVSLLWGASCISQMCGVCIPH